MTSTIEGKTKERVSQRLKSLRHELGFTQSQMAFVLGVPTGTLEAWETGRRSFSGDLEQIELAARRPLASRHTKRNLIFGKYDLRTIREAFGMTSRQFAANLHQKEKTWRNFEQDRRTMPESVVMEIEKLIRGRIDHIENFLNNPFRNGHAELNIPINQRGSSLRCAKRPGRNGRS